MTPARPCAFDGCAKEAKPRGKYCSGHYTQAGRGKALEALQERHGSPWTALLEAAIHLADLKPTDDEGWRRAKHRLRMAAYRFAARK